MGTRCGGVIFCVCEKIVSDGKSVLNVYWVNKEKFYGKSSDDVLGHVRSIIVYEKEYFDDVIRVFDKINPDLFRRDDSCWGLSDSIIGEGMLGVWRIILKKVSGKYHAVMGDIDSEVVGVVNDARLRINSVREGGDSRKGELGSVSWE